MEIPLHSLTSAWPLALGALAAGLVDSMGGGGGLITVPTLMNLGISPVFLLGTNKIISCFGSLPALFRYRHAGLLPKLGARLWIPLILLCGAAAALGAFLSQNDAYLSRVGIIVPALLFLVMVFMVKRWFRDEKKSADFKRDEAENAFLTLDQEIPARLKAKLKGVGTPVGIALISFYDGLLGPGTGAFFMTLLEHAHVRTLTANAVTKVFNFASNLGALLFFVSHGRAYWHLGLMGASAYALGNYIGAGLVLKRGQGLVRLVLLLATSSLLIRYVYRYFF